MKQFYNEIGINPALRVLSLILVGISMASCGLSKHFASSETIHLLDYGILEASTGKERYDILYNCHIKAINIGASVSYEGIDTLYLDIPKESKPIPLTRYTNFSDATIVVSNTVKDAFLFTLVGSLRPIQLTREAINLAFFRPFSFF